MKIAIEYVADNQLLTVLNGAEELHSLWRTYITMMIMVYLS